MPGWCGGVSRDGSGSDLGKGRYVEIRRKAAGDKVG
jgi:hypothetical protein